MRKINLPSGVFMKLMSRALRRKYDHEEKMRNPRYLSRIGAKEKSEDLQHMRSVRFRRLRDANIYKSRGSKTKRNMRYFSISINPEWNKLRSEFGQIKNSLKSTTYEVRDLFVCLEKEKLRPVAQARYRQTRKDGYFIDWFAVNRYLDATVKLPLEIAKLKDSVKELCNMDAHNGKEMHQLLTIILFICARLESILDSKEFKFALERTYLKSLKYKRSLKPVYWQEAAAQCAKLIEKLSALENSKAQDIYNFDSKNSSNNMHDRTSPVIVHLRNGKHTGDKIPKTTPAPPLIAEAAFYPAPYRARNIFGL